MDIGDNMKLVKWAEFASFFVCFLLKNFKTANGAIDMEWWQKSTIYSVAYAGKANEKEPVGDFGVYARRGGAFCKLR